MDPPAGFLSKNSIIKLEQRLSQSGAKPLIEQNESRKEYSAWGYEMRLGESYRSGAGEHSTERGEIITIAPGEFALLLTEETINLPKDIVAFISMRLRHKLKGLVNVSGFHVNPGYSGKLLFSVYNAAPSPVTLRHGDPIFMIIFATLDDPVSNPNHTTTITGITPDHIDLLRGPPVSLVGLGERVNNLEGQVKLWRGLVLALITGLLVAVVRGLIPPG